MKRFHNNLLVLPMDTRLQGLELSKLCKKALFYGPNGSAYHDSFETDDFLELGLSSFVRENGVIKPIPVSSLPIIPDMTSNTSGGCVASGSSFYNWTGGGPFWNAFDRNNSSGFLNAQYISGGTSLPAHLQIDLGMQKAIGAYSIRSRSVASTTYDGFPISFQLRGSNNLVNWTLVDQQSDLVWANNEVKTFQATGNFRYYQLYVTQSSTGNVTIMEFQLYEPSTPNDLIAISKKILALSDPIIVNFAALISGDLDIYATRDDGTSWDEAAQTYLYDNHDGYKVISGVADVSAQSFGNEVRYKLVGQGQCDALAMWCE